MTTQKQEMKSSVEVGKEHRGVPSAETKPTPELDAARSCKACGVKEKVTDLGGSIHLTTIAPLSRLCFDCMSGVYAA